MRMLAVMAAIGGAADHAAGQASEAILPNPVVEVQVGDGSTRATDSTGTCSCDQCTGCARPSRWRDEILPYLQDYYWGHPGNFASAPQGASVFAHFSQQVDNATIARLFLYRYDFNTGLGGDPRRLSPYGQRRLRKLAALVLQAPSPLRIEETGDAKLDEARRQGVLSELGKLLSTEIDPEKVVITDLAYPRLQGAEAILHYGNLLRQTQQGPTVRGSGGASFGTFGGGGRSDSGSSGSGSSGSGSGRNN